MIVPLYCNPAYNVSDEGYIISKRDGTPMKPSKNPRGYLITNIMMPDGSIKGMPIHSAVAKSFLGDQTIYGLEVNHIDGNKENNCLDNLEWVTRSENIKHSVDVLGEHIGVKSGQARAVYGCDKKTNQLLYLYDCMSDCARDISKPGESYRRVLAQMWRALSGMRKSFRGCIWKYQPSW